MLWVLQKSVGSIHSSELKDSSQRRFKFSHGTVDSRTRTMKRSHRRYIVYTILLTSIFWLAIEMLLLAYSNHLNIEMLEQPFYGGKLRDSSDKRQSAVVVGDTPSTNSLTNTSIAEFRSSYVTILPPNPSGPGEKGAAVKIDESEREAENIGYKKYNFNELASSKISLERSIPDNRALE